MTDRIVFQSMTLDGINDGLIVSKKRMTGVEKTGTISVYSTTQLGKISSNREKCYD